MNNDQDFVPLDDDAISFNDRAYGSWGEFSSTGAEVLYLSAHVRLGDDLDPSSASLVESIAPVREVLDPSLMSFAELLQRDLEDFRVLHKLIPYLMEQSADSVSFFPPLLAVLLPFEHNRPTSFPAIAKNFSSGVNGAWTSDMTSGDFFRFKRTVAGENGDLVRKRRTAELEWNRSKSKLVVIDGQHRAMALLALYRSLSNGNKWNDQGSQYRHFYDDTLKEKYGAQGMPTLEVPVTICLFPSLAGSEDKGAVLRAARQLFVDVNKEAKTPNRSRLILLSETELSDILTRSLLDEFRRRRQENPDEPILPLSVIEYDTPGAQALDGQPQRKVCITNIHHLHQVISAVIWGDNSWIQDITSINRRLPTGSDGVMLKQLGLRTGNETELRFKDETICELREIKRNDFPTAATEPLKQAFNSSWGSALITIFSTLEPYNTFRQTANQFETKWQVVNDAEMALAKEAFFQGVGTYWTLRDMHEKWEQDLKSQPQEVASKMRDREPSSVKAWRILQSQEAAFLSELAEKISNTSHPNDLEKRAAKQVVERAQTHAVQRGIAMSFATLVSDFNIPNAGIERFARAFVERLNQYFLDSSHPRRRYYLANLQPDGNADLAFYAFSKPLEPRRWVHIRWLILEAFFSSTHDWLESLTDIVNLDVLTQVRAHRVPQIRKEIVKTTIEEALTIRFKADEIKDQTPAVLQARQEEHQKMVARYQEWFGIDIDNDDTNAASSTGQSSLTSAAEQSDIDDDDDGDDGDEFD
jgi:hypothetical protein